MKTSNEISKITPALIKAQKSIKHAIKDAKNPHFKNNYATLESVIDATKEALLGVGIIVVQAHTTENNLVTTLIHESGEYLSSIVPLMMKANDMQQLGSATTYARRYAIASMLNISQEDDDGNAASQPQKEEKKFTPSAKPEAKPDSKIIPADYVVKVGKKYNGMILRNMLDNEIEGYIEYIKKGAADTNSPLRGDWKEFVEVATQYMNDKGPKDANDESLPF